MMLGKALRAMQGMALSRRICAGVAVLCALGLGTSLAGQTANKVQDLKKAQREVQQGEKAEAAGKLDDALAHYDEAAKDAPMNVDIVGHATHCERSWCKRTWMPRKMQRYTAT